MRIWILAENWPPRVGGIERYLTGIAGNLKGHEVTVIAPIRLVPLACLPDRQAQGKPQIIRKRFFYPLWPKWYPLYRFLLKKARNEKPDIILCGKALFEGRLALQLKKKLGIGYVVCTYGMEIATWSAHPRIRKQLVRVLEYADRILYINQKIKDELIALGTQSEQLISLYPGIDPATLNQKTKNGVLKKYNIQQPYILTVARLVPRKGLDDLIEACGRIDDKKRIQLVIVGDGPQRQYLEEHAKKFGVFAIFTGSIPDEELYALYCNAAVFALTPIELPGDYEGFGIVYCEAAYFGLPIVGTTTGGVIEAVEHGVTGILAKPGDIPAITDALATLLTNTALAQQYADAGRRRVKEKFTWNATMRSFTAYLANSNPSG